MVYFVLWNISAAHIFSERSIYSRNRHPKYVKSDSQHILAQRIEDSVVLLLKIRENIVILKWETIFVNIRNHIASLLTNFFLIQSKVED